MFKRIFAGALLLMLLVYIGVWLSAGMLIKRYYISMIENLNNRTGHYLSIPSKNYQLYLSGFPFKYRMTLENVKLKPGLYFFNGLGEVPSDIEIKGKLISEWNLVANKVIIKFQGTGGNQMTSENMILPSLASLRTLGSKKNSLEYVNFEIGFHHALLWKLMAHEKGGLEDIIKGESIKYLTVKINPFFFKSENHTKNIIKTPIQMHFRTDQYSDRNTIHFDTEPFSMCTIPDYSSVFGENTLPSIFEKCQPWTLDYDLDISFSPEMNKVLKEGSFEGIMTKPFGVKSKLNLHWNSSLEHLQLYVNFPYPYSFFDFKQLPDTYISYEFFDDWFDQYDMSATDIDLFNNLELKVMGSHHFKDYFMPSQSEPPLKYLYIPSNKSSQLLLAQRLLVSWGSLGRVLNNSQLMSSARFKLSSAQKGKISFDVISKYQSKLKGKLEISEENALGFFLGESTLAPKVKITNLGYWVDVYTTGIKEFCDLKQHKACQGLKKKVLSWAGSNMKKPLPDEYIYDAKNNPNDILGLFNIINACNMACYSVGTQPTKH
ncbi:MAG TPA: hypothetical protein QF353_05870 [Gammaproteobacteria bacterium]|nr:hypothetical protein [Gammaproteobacteria bacterium]